MRVGMNTFTVTKSVRKQGKTVVCSLELSTAIALIPVAEFKKQENMKKSSV